MVRLAGCSLVVSITVSTARHMLGVGKVSMYILVPLLHMANLSRPEITMSDVCLILAQYAQILRSAQSELPWPIFSL